MNAFENGRMLARALSGAWRKEALPLPTSDGIAENAELIIRTGAAGIVHRRLTKTPGADGDLFRQVVRQQTLAEAIRTKNLEKVLVGLAARGIEPTVIKGWTLARYYPERGLRPFADFDLVIEPHELERTCQALLELGTAAIDVPEGIARPAFLGTPVPNEAPKPQEICVDLHLGHHRLIDRIASERDRRVLREKLGEASVRTLGPEDHLRTVALHLFEHATWRSLCLVDIAILVEHHAHEIDWNYLFAGEPRRTEAVVMALRLSHEILGARFDLRVLDGRPSLPRWLPSTLLRIWGTPFKPAFRFDEVARTPTALWEAAKRRWPNPIVATFAIGGSFNNLPRLPYQLVDFLGRGKRYLVKRARNRLSAS